MTQVVIGVRFCGWAVTVNNNVLLEVPDSLNLFFYQTWSLKTTSNPSKILFLFLIKISLTWKKINLKKVCKASTKEAWITSASIDSQEWYVTSAPCKNAKVLKQQQCLKLFQIYEQTAREPSDISGNTRRDYYQKHNLLEHFIFDYFFTTFDNVGHNKMEHFADGCNAFYKLWFRGLT